MSQPMDGVLGLHLNPLTCGVAKFNLMFARKLGVRMINVFDQAAAAMASPLLSLKMAEFTVDDVQALNETLDAAPWRQTYRLFLHAWTDTPIEHRLLTQAARVYCGNSELVERLSPLRADVVPSWCPWTLLEPQRFKRTELSVFSFGMAHKVRSDLYRKLHVLLEGTGKSYSVFLSTALHEGTAFDESFTIVFEELRQIFGEHIYFLGYMSDTAVYNYLLDTTFFAAFFDSGVRANNTTVNAALECGSVVITNTDKHSPASLAHGDTMLDIHACVALPTDEQELTRLGGRARAIGRDVLGWDALMNDILQHDVQRTRKETR